MTMSGGVFGPLERLSEVLGSFSMLEMRVENDGDGNPIYIGYTLTANGSTSAKIWYIIKCEYDATFLTRKILPNGYLSFVYAWDDRATYF